MTGPTRPAARVLVLSGPSGSGKTRLADRLHREHGWPVVHLDDFYKDGDDPGLPMSPIGVPDWDDVRSWQVDAALAALTKLCRDGDTELPAYDIARSARTGHTHLARGGSPVVIAEGIFAAYAIDPLRAAGLLLDAYCIRQPLLLTIVRRLVRDVGEHRKPLRVLVRRGIRLARAEPAIIARDSDLGARPANPCQAEREVRVMP